jgi:hypothetical protein
MMNPMDGGCGHISGALMAATAALGWWILRQAEKDVTLMRWTGRVVGWTLTAVGMCGFLCAAVSHAKRLSSCGGQSMAKCAHHGSMGGGLPYGHPSIEGPGAVETQPAAIGKQAK